VHAAAGLRTTARWVAGAFAGIPSLAIVGSLVRAPGDAGFDAWLLGFGIFLAAIGAYTGIQAFARVLAPLGLADDTISDAVMEDLPETRFATYAELREELERGRDGVGAASANAADAEGWAAAAKAEADAAEAVAKTLAEMKEGDQPDEDTVAARRFAREKSREAGRRAAGAAIRKNELSLSTEILGAYETQRRRAYLLQAGETVGKRFADSNKWAFVAVVLVSIGIFLLALAPNEKRPEAEPPTLVTLDLTAEGVEALGCEASEIPALRVGGASGEPTMIVLPGGPCPARTVKFREAKPKPLGRATEVKPVGGE
jgi:hypothetical protein